MRARAGLRSARTDPAKLNVCLPASLSLAHVSSTLAAALTVSSVFLSLFYALYRARSPAHSYSRPLQPITKHADSDFDIIGYPPEIEPEAIQKAPSRARAQRSAAPPPAAPPPYESSSSVGGDASVDRSSLMSSFTHTYESTSIARVDARTANPYPSMSGASARQEVDYVLYDVDPFNATQTPTRGTKHNRMCTCVRVICARAFDVQYVIVRA